VEKLLQLERKHQAAASPCKGPQPRPQPRLCEPSPLTPDLKGFIDRVVVPILVQSYLAEMQSEKKIAESSVTVASVPTDD
jgi:hypothetical protein